MNTLRQPSSRGFTLIELLAVIGVLMLMLSFLAPGINGSMRGLSLTTQGNALSDSIALARQTAITKNREVELRLVKLPYLADDTGGWGVQLWEIDPTGDVSKAFTPLSRFNESIVINSELSPMIASLPSKNANFGTSLGSRPYHAIRFRSTGRIVDQFGPNNYLTLSLRHEDTATPQNFYTLQFNAMTGGAQIFRP